ncbi:hypothetical protein F0169_04175 [Pseudomonas sp. MAFF 212408]|uniref:Uncharacterized protein n=1 Tax=Pseudomonas kitaguniensis TaxID=2607908 RepID=A0A5N7KI81_9PSED|nr:hypothetical protein [Pseudomonas kitaguniensis]MPR01342.1 hypothetical protein [Pseudomonas kitaguniensis]
MIKALASQRILDKSQLTAMGRFTPVVTAVVAGLRRMQMTGAALQVGGQIRATTRVGCKIDWATKGVADT